MNEVEPYYEDNQGDQGDAFSISIYGPQAWCPQISNNMFLMVRKNFGTVHYQLFTMFDILPLDYR